MTIKNEFEKNNKKCRLVIIRSNPVNPDPRVEKEAHTLLKAGYDVSIFCWDRNSKYKLRKVHMQVPAGSIGIYRVGIPAQFGAGIKSLKPFILFQLTIFGWLIKNRKEYEIIHACDFDTAFTAFLLTRLLKKKIIFDIFDYLYTRIEGKHKLFKRCIVFLQHKIINGADATIICSEKRKEQIKGSFPRILGVIHNSPQRREEIGNRFILDNNKVKIIYVGILQDYRYLKELAKLVIANNLLELHIGGFGKYEEYFRNLTLENRNVIYYGKLSYNETLELESKGDIMTALYDPSVDNHYYAAPNKFYEALMLGKPLIMIRNTGMADIVEKYDIGEVIDNNIESLEKGINNLVKRKAEWPIISKKMQSLYEKDYSWEKMEKRLIDVYKNVCWDTKKVY